MTIFKCSGNAAQTGRVQHAPMFVREDNPLLAMAIRFLLWASRNRGG